MVRVDAAPAFEFGILVNAVRSHEYDDPDAETTSKSTSKYIESVSNASWAFCVTVDSRKLDLKVLYSAQLYCDGKRVSSYVMFDPLYHEDSRKHRAGGEIYRTFNDFHYVEGSRTYRQKFKFGDLKTTEEPLREAHKELIPQLSQIGSIELQLWRNYPCSSVMKASKRVKFNALDAGIDGLPKKALKGRSLSHTITSCEASIPVQPIEHIEARPMDRTPMACYSFKYLSKRCLQALLIVPRSPCHNPVDDNDDDLDNMSPEELRVQLRTLRARKPPAERDSKRELMRRVKREAAVEEDDDLSVTSCRRAKAAKIEVVDLTD